MCVCACALGAREAAGVIELAMGSESRFSAPQLLFSLGQVYLPFLSVLAILVWFVVTCVSGSAMCIIMSDIAQLSLFKAFTNSSQVEKTPVGWGTVG